MGRLYLLVLVIPIVMAMWMALSMIDDPPSNITGVNGTVVSYQGPSQRSGGHFGEWVDVEGFTFVKLPDGSTRRTAMEPVSPELCRPGSSAVVRVRIGRIYPRIIKALFAVCGQRLEMPHK